MRVSRRGYIVGACVALVAAVVAVSFLWRGDGDPEPAARPSPSLSSTANSTVKGPFDGTPAASFASGEAGLVMPAAKTTGAWSEQEVAAALQKVRAALIASHLDHRIIVDHDVSAFLATLCSACGDHLGKEFAAGRFGLVAQRIAKEWKLAAEPPRVSGHTTFRESKWGEVKVLEVVTNYVWVYPFDLPQEWSGERVVVAHDEVRWVFPKDADVDGSYRGMSQADSKGYLVGMECGQAKLGYLAPRPHRSTTTQDALYRPDHPFEVEKGCA